MRTREDIESAWEAAINTGWNGGSSGREISRNQRLILETLLDIRDLLTTKST